MPCRCAAWRNRWATASAGDGASWAVEGDASWGSGARTEVVLDSRQTEGVVLCVLGERTYSTVRLLDRYFVTSLMRSVTM